VDEIGLFPLPIVLLPGEYVPLHIFELRYKELIGECLDAGLELGLVFSDNEGMRTIGTRAVPARVLRRYPDGRLDIVIKGQLRFRVMKLTEGRSFPTAKAQGFHDEKTRRRRRRSRAASRPSPASSPQQEETRGRPGRTASASRSPLEPPFLPRSSNSYWR
jgi:Lon protease-like protein